jgi:two-component system NtrC family sensor kinase
VDLAAVLDATLLFLSEKLDRRGIQVVRDLRVAPTVMGDPERLQQLFLNLFLNAADAMPRGGELRLALHPCQDGVEVWVADTGEGIPATDLPRVFDPFFTTKAAGEGNGLGLAVAQGIVTDHGGTIEVGSTPGKGTEFRIRLPDSGGVPGQD